MNTETVTPSRFDYLLTLLNETSTARGLIVMITLALGYVLDPAKIEVYTTAAVALGAVLKVALPDYWSRSIAAAAAVAAAEAASKKP